MTDVQLSQLWPNTSIEVIQLIHDGNPLMQIFHFVSFWNHGESNNWKCADTSGEQCIITFHFIC